MTRRVKVWLVGSAIFSIGNLLGGVYAALEGEPAHAGLHFGLMVLGAYATWRFAVRARAEERSDVPPSEARLEQLQQSVDAVAIEVERLGEAQRFNSKLQAERMETRR